MVNGFTFKKFGNSLDAVKDMKFKEYEEEVKGSILNCIKSAGEKAKFI